jgi:nicotinate-nucleotide adenylyltransferase
LSADDAVKAAGVTAIGVLGGSFDPVHNAHLAMAAAALDTLGLPRILWIPSGNPPHRNPPVASAADRAAMVRLAIAGDSRQALDERELHKATPGYTVETLEDLRATFGAGTEFVLLIGADQHARLRTWHRHADLYSLARIAVFARPGETLDTDARVTVVPMAPLDISSTELRRRIGAGEPVRGLLPDAVLDYIRRHGLYSREARKVP